jgi:superoxide reductase
MEYKEFLMVEKKAVYKCDKCGNIMESLWNGKPSVFCCGEEMKLLNPNTVEASKEKHIPVIERNGNEVTVKVGSVLHPMEKGHYILFIELIDGDNVLRHDFKEGDSQPVVKFLVEGKNLKARAYCNLHGFWEG